MHDIMLCVSDPAICVEGGLSVSELWAEWTSRSAPVLYIQQSPESTLTQLHWLWVPERNSRGGFISYPVNVLQLTVVSIAMYL